MHRFGPEVLETIRRAREHKVKVSIFDDRGCLLWFCEEWESEVGVMEKWKEALGLGWLEFVHSDDVKKCIEWIAAPDGAILHFRSVHPTQKGQWQKVTLIKRRVGLYWVAIGERNVLDNVEVPPNTDAVFCLGALLLISKSLLDGLNGWKRAA